MRKSLEVRMKCAYLCSPAETKKLLENCNENSEKEIVKIGRKILKQ